MTVGADYYALLDVDAHASVDEILASYRAKIRSVHPDLGPASEFAERDAKTALLNEARAVLCDPTSRARYDQTRGPRPRGERAAEPASSGVGRSPSGHQPGGPARTPPRPPRPPSAGAGPSQTRWRPTRDRARTEAHFVDSDFGTSDGGLRFQWPSPWAVASVVQPTASVSLWLLSAALRLLAGPVGLYLLILLVAFIMDQTLR